MSQKKETVALLGYAGVIAVVEWEEEGKSGKLNFHGASDLLPYEFKIEHLKGTHIPLARVSYLLNGKEKARFVVPARNGVDLDTVTGYAVNASRGDSQVPKTLFSKVSAYVSHVGPYKESFPSNLDKYEALRAITKWADHVLKAHGPHYEVTGIYNYSTGEVEEAEGFVDFTDKMLKKGFPIYYRMLLHTPGYVIPGLDRNDNIIAAIALGMEPEHIARLLVVKEKDVRNIATCIVEQGEAQNDSKLYPIGTIFVTERPMPLDVRIIRFWQVIRCTERTLWVQEVHADQAVPSDRDRFPVRDMPVNNTIHMCRINLKAHRETPIHIDGELATVWAGKVLTKDRLWSYRS